MAALFSILSALVTIYTILCFIEIIMSWIPGAKFTSFGKFISQITEPYMNFFRRRWLIIGNIDFSPVVSIGLLSIISSILGGINSTGRIYFGGILATIISMLWEVISSLLSIVLLVVFIRWIVLVIKKGYTPFDSPWNQFDQMIQKFCYKVSGTFTKKTIKYQTSLLINWIVFAVILVGGRILFTYLALLCNRLPF